jgi:transcriptional regulator with PAS, ATPase and Fis domain
MDPKRETEHRTESFIQKSGFFKKLFDHMQIGVIVTDHQGYIVYLNDVYGRFLQIDPAAQIGKYVTELVENSRMHVVAMTGKAEINYPHRFKDKSYLVHRIPIEENGKVIAVLGLLLFDSATTAVKLAEKLSLLESKLDLYENELLSLRLTHYTIHSIIGASRAIKDLKKEALRAAATNLPVVITGESGTGKELFAQAIHHASARRFYPFVKINCSAIPKDLIESELFGYERGAFTGARSRGKPGKFELAHHGSVFLDEIGDLPLEMQPKLLRVLEEKVFERVGGTSVIKADFRLLAATNQNLEEMLEEKRFRKDLFYRLNVIPLHIPALRERRDDIIPLVRHLLKNIAEESGVSELVMDPEAEEILVNADWPGNVRELSNVLERAVSYLDRDTIYPSDLPFRLYRNQESLREPDHRSLKNLQDAAEKEAIRDALESTNYNKRRAADLLGIHRSVLYKKIRKYNLPLQR